MRESFVFISHADKDKALIRPVLEALIARRVKIWLDNPAGLEFSKDQIDQHFFRLSAGAGWHKDGIQDALRRAACVLFLASQKFLEPRRNVWRDEVSYALTSDILVGARLDDVAFDPSNALLPAGLGAEQLPTLARDVSGASFDTRLGMLLDDVEAKMKQTLCVNTKGGNAERTEMRSRLGPYLIDRARQEGALQGAMRELAAKDGVRAFAIAGPENEGLEGFRDRLRLHAGPKALGHSWQELDAAWPVGEPASTFEDSYLASLRAELRTSFDAGADGVAAALADYRKPVAVISTIYPSQWKSDESRRLRAWLAFWGALNAHPGLKVVPILWIPMPNAKAGWKRHFDEATTKGLREVPPSGERGAVSNAAIWKCVLGVRARPAGLFPQREARERAYASFSAMPVLHPVRWPDVAPWLRLIAPEGIVESPWATQVSAAAKAILDAPGVRRRGVELETFAAHVMPKFISAQG